MQLLRNNNLLLVVFMAFTLPQAYSSFHAVFHEHSELCTEVNNQHFHEYHPDCKVCDHVLPAVYPVVFLEADFVLNSNNTTVSSWYNQPATCINQDLTLLRGPPGFMFFC
jgi:hypothetical protein